MYQIEKQTCHSKPGQHIYFDFKEGNNNDIYLDDSFLISQISPLRISTNTIITHDIMYLCIKIKRRILKIDIEVCSVLK